MKLRLFGLVAVLAALAFPSVASGGDPAPSATEREFTGLLNQKRAEVGLAPVQISFPLTDVADDYVAYNVEQGGISHDRDPPFTARANQAGCGKWSGPVLARGYAGPAEVLEGWLSSEGHRAVLLDPDNTHIGAGFKGDHALAYVMPCTGAQNDSGDYGDPTAVEPPLRDPPPDVEPPLRDPPPDVEPDPDPLETKAVLLRFTQLRVRGRMVTTRVHVRSGQARLRLVVRSGRRVVRGRPVVAAKRARAYRLALRVPRSGRWRISLRAGERTVRRFARQVQGI